MKKAEIINYFDYLEKKHKSDVDGGYSFLDSMVQYVCSLTEKDIEIAINILMSLVEKEDKNFWGVALECLIRINKYNTADRIMSIYKANLSKSIYWKDQLVFALIRLKSPKYSKFCSKYVESALAGRMDSLIPLVAALILINKKSYIKLASEFWVIELSNMKIFFQN